MPNRSSRNTSTSSIRSVYVVIIPAASVLLILSVSFQFRQRASSSEEALHEGPATALRLKVRGVTFFLVQVLLKKLRLMAARTP